jgi:hypothetical protein
MSDEQPETPDLDDPRIARDRGYRDGFTGQAEMPGFPPGDPRAEAYGDGYRLGAYARQRDAEPGAGQLVRQFMAGLGATVTFEGTLEEFAAYVAQVEAVDEAEMAMRGEHPVSVVHGDPESELDALLMFGWLPRAAGVLAGQDGGRVAGTIGGNDYTTWRFAGPGAAAAAAAFADYARLVAAHLNRTWWNVTETPGPVFPGWGPG